jgi:hypothetical protein
MPCDTAALRECTVTVLTADSRSTGSSAVMGTRGKPSCALVSAARSAMAST